MKKLLIIFFLLFHSFSFSQSANLILQVNGKIKLPQFFNVYLTLDLEGHSKKMAIDYLPADLKLTEEAWSIIKSQPDKKFFCMLITILMKKESRN